MKLKALKKKTSRFLLYLFLSIEIVLLGFSNLAFAAAESTKTWHFSSSTASDYTYNTSLVSIDAQGAHPIDEVNKLTNPSFAASADNWTIAETNVPDGWVIAPGSSTYSTEDFLVSKYEIKCALNASPTVGLTAPDTGYHTYNDSGAGGTACTSANSRQPVSITSGYPIAQISQTESIDRCSAIILNSTTSNTAHLISNEEWMTIARDAEVQDSNWFGGTAGTNFMFMGHNDNGPALALVASTDNDPYSGTGDSTIACDNHYTNFVIADETTSGRACVGQKRIQTLSNSSVIWDLSGNVYEWVNKSITCALDVCTSSEMPYAAVPASEWVEYASGVAGFNVLATYGSLTWNDLGPLHTAYNSDYGIGRLYTDANAAAPSGTTHAFFRGGYWVDGAYAGAFTLHLSYAPGLRYHSIGLRCASDSVDISQSWQSTTGHLKSGFDRISTANVLDARLYQSVNLGDTETYDFSAYLYDRTSGSEGGEIDENTAQLWYNGAVLATTYTSAGSGWWKLTGELTGADESREFGVLVKAGKTVDVDDFTLALQGEYSLYTTSAFSHPWLKNWESFSSAQTASYNAKVNFQLCDADGSSCETNSSWKYWDGDSWETVSNTTTDVNSAGQLTETAMEAFPISSQKISFKAIFSFGGDDIPYINPDSVSIGFSTTAAVTPKEPGDKSYTSSKRPTFKFKATENAQNYDLKINNGEEGDFEVNGIPSNQDNPNPWETSKYTVSWEGFKDASADNYISLFTRSSDEWADNQNNGELKEGRRSFSVTAKKDGISQENSAVFFADFTRPGNFFNQINSLILDKDYSLEDKAFATSETKPTVYFKVIDPLSGGDPDIHRDDGVASGPQKAKLSLEKKQPILNTWQMIEQKSLSFPETYWTDSQMLIEDNAENKADKQAMFKWSPYEKLTNGVYRLCLDSKDKAGNKTSQNYLYLKVSSWKSLASQEQKQVFEEKAADKQTKEPVEPEPITKEIPQKEAEELMSVSPASQKPSFLSNAFSSASNTALGLSYWIKNVFSSTGDFIARQDAPEFKLPAFKLGKFTAFNFEKPASIAFGLSEWLAFVPVSFGEFVLDDKPTEIFDVRIEDAGVDYVVISWKTNRHTYNNKVNLGEDGSYGISTTSPNYRKEHKVKIENLKPNTRYRFEVMSQAKNYVFDADYEFWTLEE